MSVNLCKRCGKPTWFAWQDYCWQCEKEIAKEQIQEAIRDGEEDVDTGSRDYVICPYCGEAIETCYGYEDFPELYEEGDHEVECPECEKTFVLETSISYYYETRKAEE